MSMWRGAWIGTRWWFVAVLILLLAQSAVDIATFAPAGSHSAVILGDSFGIPHRPFPQWIQEIVRLSGTFKGYEWVHFYRDNLPGVVTLFAVLVGAGGVLQRRSGRLFTLSLPVSRTQLVVACTVTYLCELAALALIPALSVPLFAPLVGQSYPIADALVYALHSFVGGTVFFFGALLLSAIFYDWRQHSLAWTALLIAVGSLVFAAFFPVVGAYTPGGLMSGESYFRSGSLELPVLAAWLAMAAVMFVAVVRSLEQRDF
jgi:hypothetical protein